MALAEFGDPIPGRDQSGSESPNEDVVVPDVPEATTDEEIELGELSPSDKRVRMLWKYNTIDSHWN